MRDSSGRSGMVSRAADPRKVSTPNCTGVSGSTSSVASDTAAPPKKLISPRNVSGVPLRRRMEVGFMAETPGKRIFCHKNTTNFAALQVCSGFVNPLAHQAKRPYCPKPAPAVRRRGSGKRRGGLPARHGGRRDGAAPGAAPGRPDGCAAALALLPRHQTEEKVNGAVN